MDVKLPDRPLRRLVWGAFEGVFLGTALYVPAIVARVVGPAPSWREALPFLVVGAVVCASGQYLARGILGACIGLVAGALLGSTLGDDAARPTLARHHLGREAVVSGVTLSGRPFDVKEQRGKVVLVDFWATWCPPCREELPRLKALYDQHHAAGLEIVGVSLDSDHDKLADFVRKQGIAWPQIVSDKPGEDGWKNPLLYRYVVQSIPYTLLVDREGWIVASGLTGSRLEEAVEKVLAGDKPAEPSWVSLGDPIANLFAALGWLGGMLVERRFRQLAAVRGAEARP